MDNKKLYVGGLSYDAQNEDLTEAFAPFGTVEDVRIITDKFTGRSKGFGFVTFSSDEEANAAIDAMHEKEFMGRTITVNVARPREERPARSFDRDRAPRRY